MKECKKLGFMKAEYVLDKLEGGQPKLLPMEIKQKQIDKIIYNILILCPEEEETLRGFVIESILEFQNSKEMLIEAEFRPVNATLDERSFINLTDVTIPFDIKLALSFGPKFCFPTRNDLESLIRFLDDFCSHLEINFPIETHFEAYKQVSIELSRENKREILTREVWLNFLNYRVKNFKFNNPELLITRSDKGKHTVLIKKKEYIAKMNEMVINTSDYVRIGSVDISLLEKRNNEYVDVLFDSGTIKTKFAYADNCSLIAQMYGLVKVHKSGFPMRPITSACAAPGFKLAKLFTSILDSVFCEDGFHIRNSTQFVNDLSNVSIDSDDKMISFDVVSMFTNIPIEHMIHLISHKKNVIESDFHIEFDFFKEILLFLLRDCAIFSWDSNPYKQKDSLAMGSPLSPILAKILMSDVIEKTLPLLNCKPKLISLYVDDSFWVVNKRYINEILVALNKYHHKIKFTVEVERSNEINFLDVTVIRNGNNLITNWYKKSYASSRLLNYFSQHEKTCIVETAKSYIRMVLNLSDGKFFQSNKVILEQILRDNSFPETEIMCLMHENYTYMRLPKEKEAFTGSYVPIKYRGNLTGRLKKKIHPFIDNSRLVGTPDRSNSNTFSYLKDRISIGEKTNLVLIFSCKCNKFKIIRMTGFLERAKAIIDLIKENNKVQECNIFEHNFNKLKSWQCKNYSSTRRIYDMVAYAHRDSLVDTKFNPPVFQFSKHLNKVFLSQ